MDEVREEVRKDVVLVRDGWQVDSVNITIFFLLIVSSC